MIKKKICTRPMFKVQIFEFQSEQSPIFVKERASDVPPRLKNPIVWKRDGAGKWESER